MLKINVQWTLSGDLTTNFSLVKMAVEALELLNTLQNGPEPVKAKAETIQPTATSRAQADVLAAGRPPYPTGVVPK